MKNIIKYSLKKQEINIKSKEEIYQILRKKINIISPSTKVISVISENSGDGKTEITAMLASAFAKAGKKVLMIDGNLREPDLTSRFLDVNGIGFDDLLIDCKEISEAVIKLEEKLYIIPTKRHNSLTTKLLESNKFDKIIEYCKEYFDIVIIDTLALSIDLDGFLISEKSDGVLFVTVENKTKTKKLEEYKITLDKAGITIIGAVINSTN